jgi:DNA invertase Pin-like site-specific DNA recombinase
MMDKITKGGFFMAEYGYARVSTREQNEARQLAALKKWGIKKKRLIMDKQSGKDFCRPGWQSLMERLQPGDLVVVQSIDRLGRSYEDILEQWRTITREKGADLLVLDMPMLDTRAKGKDLTGKFISDMVLQVLSYVAQTERENIRRRQAEGIAAAKARGVRFGPRPLPLPPEFDAAVREYRAGKLSVRQAARRSGMSTTTFFKRANHLVG